MLRTGLLTTVVTLVVLVAIPPARADMMLPGARIDVGFVVERATLPPGRVLIAVTESGRCFEPVLGRAYTVAKGDPTTVYDVAVEMTGADARPSVRGQALCRGGARTGRSRRLTFLWTSGARVLFTSGGAYNLWEGETSRVRREVSRYAVEGEPPVARRLRTRYECRNGRSGLERGVCGGEEEKGGGAKALGALGLASMLELLRRTRRRRVQGEGVAVDRP